MVVADYLMMGEALGGSLDFSAFCAGYHDYGTFIAAREYVLTLTLFLPASGMVDDDLRERRDRATSHAA